MSAGGALHSTSDATREGVDATASGGGIVSVKFELIKLELGNLEVGRDVTDDIMVLGHTTPPLVNREVTLVLFLSQTLWRTAFSLALLAAVTMTTRKRRARLRSARPPPRRKTA